MKLWVYSVGVLAAMTVIVILLLKYTYVPTPEVVMKPSFFTQPEDIGQAILRRFYSPLVQKQLVAFGIPPQPEWQQGIVRGFIIAAAQEKAPIDVLLVERQMPAFNISGLPPMDLQTVETNTETQSELIDRMTALHKAGKRVLLVTASIYTSHLVMGNPIHRYEQATGERVFSVTSGPLVLSANDETKISPPCVGSEIDRDGTAPLGCAFLKASRGYYSKRMKDDRYIAIMNEPAAEDELLMVSPPAH